MVQKNKKTEPYKYVGHLTFPNDPKIIDIFFKPPGKKTVYVLKYNGETVQQSEFNKEFVQFLKSIGYEYIPLKMNESRRRPYGRFENIPVTPTIEKVDDKNTDETEIVVAYPTKTLPEITDRGKYILSKVYEMTGILGKGDIYGKMELC